MSFPSCVYLYTGRLQPLHCGQLRPSLRLPFQPAVRGVRGPRGRLCHPGTPLASTRQPPGSSRRRRDSPWRRPRSPYDIQAPSQRRYANSMTNESCVSDPGEIGGLGKREREEINRTTFYMGNDTEIRSLHGPLYDLRHLFCDVCGSSFQSKDL